MVIDTVQDAAWQEIQSVGGASAILVVISEMLQFFEIGSTQLVLVLHLIVMIGNMYWQYVDNGGLEEWTVPKQLSRMGVNVTVFFVGLGLYGLFLGYYGITDQTEMSKHLHVMVKDASWINGVLAYVTAAVMYSLDRAIANFLLALVPIFKMIVGGY